MTSPEAVEAILNKTFSIIETMSNNWSILRSDFKLLSGEEEALFGWISANVILSGKFNGNEQTFGSLDMGGASAQKVNSCQKQKNASFEYCTETSLFGSVYQLTSSSALCYGLEEGMKRFAASLIYESYQKANKTLEKSIINPCLSQNLRYQVL